MSLIMFKLLLFLVGPLAVLGNQADTVMKSYIPACKCQAWSAAGANITVQWASQTKMMSAGASCAMPANGNRAQNYKPWCVCDGTNKPTACAAPMSVPEQINLQLAASNVVVAAFVTFETSLPTAPPQATLTEESTGVTSQLTGVSHWYITSHSGTTPKRDYALHFVRFLDLQPHASYTYKVMSGAANASWSDEFTFRAPYADGLTKIGIYGDMGNTQYNNQENLGRDCASGAIDAIVHMGDHAYNMGDTDDSRGDSYMNAFSQAALSSCPWMPVIGNHESTQCPGDEVDESTHERYLNQTWGVAYGETTATSSATTALGHLLTRGSLFGAGVHGSKPSGTSQWYSVDLGLVHIVGLDMDPGSPPHAPIFSGVQQAWLEQDLAAANANRANVPWIIVTSHFPLYNAEFEGNLNASASFYVGAEAEMFATSGHDFVPCDVDGCRTVGEILRTSKDNLEPLLAKYAVDVYDAGHVHSYDVTWPMCKGAICNATNPKSYHNPKGTVHITEGNGGVPGVVGVNTLKPCKTVYGNMCGTGGAYGRFTAFNASVLMYEHVENPTGNVTHTWAITRS